MKKQKDAIVELVKSTLGAKFVPYKDDALSLLNSVELELIKASIRKDIENGSIAYSKDRSNYEEVRIYSRSVVMNHLKKSLELNGNKSAGSSTKTSKTTASNKITQYSESLPEYLKEFVIAEEL